MVYNTYIRRKGMTKEGVGELIKEHNKNMTKYRGKQADSFLETGSFLLKLHLTSELGTHFFHVTSSSGKGAVSWNNSTTFPLPLPPLTL